MLERLYHRKVYLPRKLVSYIKDIVVIIMNTRESVYLSKPLVVPNTAGPQSDDACIRSLLQQSLEQETNSLQQDERARLGQLCDEVATMVSSLHARSDQQDPQAAQEMDSEVLDLYHEVCAADARVRQLRREVPGELLAAMVKELAGSRPACLQPAAGTSPGVPGVEHADQPADRAVRGSEEPLAESASEADADAVPPLACWGQLTDITNKVPTLMAKLDSTLQRLTRVISITEADNCRPSPRTVEKVLLGQGRRSVHSDDFDHDQGADNTRQRLAYDLGA